MTVKRVTCWWKSVLKTAVGLKASFIFETEIRALFSKAGVVGWAKHFAYDAVRLEQHGATINYPFNWDEVDGAGKPRLLVRSS